MSKREQYYEQAQELYVVKQCSFDEIGRRLGIAEKTVRTWAKDGEWASKRAALLSKRGTMHEMIYDTAYMLLESLRKDLADGVPVDPGRLYAINRLIATIEQSRKYEQVVGIDTPKEEAPVDTKLTEEKLEEIRNTILRL